MQLAETTPDLSDGRPGEAEAVLQKGPWPVKIAVAKDEAFCFHYEDNLEFLRELGAVLTEFSPLHDKTLPEEADGLILPGGYPELYAEALSKNQSMRRSIREALAKGLPCRRSAKDFYIFRKN